MTSNIMFYFDWKINFVEIIISLVIVVLTTGITYYLFSVLPANKRKKSLKNRISKFRDELFSLIMDNKDEFRNSYELYEEKATEKKYQGEDDLFWHLINIKDWLTFLSNFRNIILLDINFNEYWQVNELIFLINNFVMDDKKYIDLSLKLSELSGEIKHMKILIGSMADNIWEIKHEKELIKSKHDNELLSFGISSVE